MRNYDELKNRLEEFSNAYLNLIETFEKEEEDVNDFLTQPEIYDCMSRCFAPTSLNELPIPDWADLIIDYLTKEKKTKYGGTN